MFPAVGLRNNSDGSLNNNGTWGYYWSSDYYNSTNAYNMYFNSSSVNTDWNNKANGFSVRCVRQRIYDPQSGLRRGSGGKPFGDSCPGVPRKFSRLLGEPQTLLVERMAVRFDMSRIAFCKRLLTNSATLEFPAVGRRNYSDGSLNNAGTNGYYWASDQNNASNAYRMNFNSSDVNTNNNNKANGFSVRCVRQEFTTLIFLSSLKHRQYRAFRRLASPV